MSTWADFRQAEAAAGGPGFESTGLSWNVPLVGGAPPGVSQVIDQGLDEQLANPDQIQVPKGATTRFPNATQAVLDGIELMGSSPLPWMAQDSGGLDTSQVVVLTMTGLGIAVLVLVILGVA